MNLRMAFLWLFGDHIAVECAARKTEIRDPDKKLLGQ
jgi:hypothetical protein